MILFWLLALALGIGVLRDWDRVNVVVTGMVFGYCLRLFDAALCATVQKRINGTAKENTP